MWQQDEENEDNEEQAQEGLMFGLSRGMVCVLTTHTYTITMYVSVYECECLY